MTERDIELPALLGADYLTEDRCRFWNITSLNDFARAAVLADRLRASKPPSPDFYAYLGMLLCFKAEKMREAAAAATGEKTNG